MGLSHQRLRKNFLGDLAVGGGTVQRDLAIIMCVAVKLYCWFWLSMGCCCCRRASSPSVEGEAPLPAIWEMGMSA